jgi:hypothetical protein
MGNRSLLNGPVLDWLDDRFGKSPHALSASSRAAVAQDGQVLRDGSTGGEKSVESAPIGQA